jgi:predicted alternative tryptophan synthase beta-subunit
MRFWLSALKPARDTVVVSVYWGNENSYRIALIRRSDAATAFVDIPQELRGEFARFDRDMVLLRAGELRIAVA